MNIKEKKNNKFLNFLKLIDREENKPREWSQVMLVQDGIDLLKFHFLKNNMTIQQICGVSVVFFTSFCNIIFIKNLKYLLMIIRKTDFCLKEILVFCYHLVN